ncbi:MAG: hypothetical protein FWC76_01805 [Defluviitaleaceae bacterium]|nr:hypothetical protein [Defluviitaleaceae bacterium]
MIDVCYIFDSAFLGIVAFVALADYIERKMKNKRRPINRIGKRRLK